MAGISRVRQNSTAKGKLYGQLRVNIDANLPRTQRSIWIGIQIKVLYVGIFGIYLCAYVSNYLRNYLWFLKINR